MKKRVIAGLLIGFFALGLCSCGNADIVSKEEYDKVVAERDNYKQLYEEAIGAGIEEANAITTEAISGDSDNSSNDSEFELWEVELTTDNIMDYVQFGVYDEKDAFGDLTGCHQLVAYSKVFDKGWYFYGVSDDFAIEYSCNGDTSVGTSPFTSVCFWGGDADEFSAADVSVARVQGSVIFINQSSVKNFKFDTGERDIEFIDGTGHTELGSGMYEGFPY